jgi:hypothetical protein
LKLGLGRLGFCGSAVSLHLLYIGTCGTCGRFDVISKLFVIVVKVSVFNGLA